MNVRAALSLYTAAHEGGEMLRYLSKTPVKEYPAGVRIVHNFPPGPPEDPGQHREVGDGGFRVWVTDEEQWGGKRCYCGWLNGREHYGTRVSPMPEVQRDEKGGTV